jgi:hypothetical protein
MHDPDVRFGHDAVGAAVGLQLAIFLVSAVVAAGFFPVPAGPQGATGECERKYRADK